MDMVLLGPSIIVIISVFLSLIALIFGVAAVVREVLLYKSWDSEGLEGGLFQSFRGLEKKGEGDEGLPGNCSGCCSLLDNMLGFGWNSCMSFDGKFCSHSCLLCFWGGITHFACFHQSQLGWLEGGCYQRSRRSLSKRDGRKI